MSNVARYFGRKESNDLERDCKNDEPLLGERLDEVFIFYDLVRDVHCNLYAGCTNFSKLSFIMHLYHIKCSSG